MPVYDYYKDDPLNPNVPALQESGRREATEAFVSTMVWHLETMAERGTPRSDGKRPKVLLRRFCPGIPYASVRAVLDVLTDKAHLGVVDPVISGVIEPGKWRVRVTLYRKDSRYERVDAKDATATIIQDLVPWYEDGEGEDFTVGGNCSSERTATYVWDAATVEDPPATEVGVTYSIQSINRDDETGLFSYILVKDRALTQHTGPYVSRKTNGVTETTEMWRNAYTIPEGLEAGTTYDEEGVMTQVSIVKNEDCTYNITVQRTEVNEHDSAYACTQTILAHTDSTTTGGNEAPLGETPEAADGVIYRHESKKEDDGTYTNTVQTTTELPVQEFAVQKTVTRDGTRIETTHRNQAEVPEVELSIGETLGYQKTEGGLYNVSKVEFEVADPLMIACSNCTTIYDDVQVHVKTVAEQGEEEASASNGVIVNLGYDMTELGTWRETRQVATELEVEEASVATQNTFSRKMTRVTNCHVAEPVDLGEKLGEAVSQKTAGGIYDTSIVSYEGKNASWEYVAAQTVFEKTCVVERRGAPEKWESTDTKTQVRVGVDEASGLYDGNKFITTPIFACASRGATETFDEVVTRKSNRNCTCSYFNGFDCTYKAGCQIVEYSAQQTNVCGVYDIAWSVSKPKELWVACTVDTLRDNVKVYRFVYANSPVGWPVPEQVCNAVKGLDVDKVANISPSFNRDKYGLWSGQVVVMVDTSVDDSGGGGAADEEHKSIVHAREVIPHSDGSLIQRTWEATKHEGYDPSLDSVYNRVETHHDPRVEEICGANWRSEIQWMRHEGHKSWAGRYVFYSGLCMINQVRLVVKKDGSSSAK